MALLAMEPGRVDVLATELQRVRPHADEAALLLELGCTLSELQINSLNRLHEVGARCEAVGRQLSESADVIETEIDTPSGSNTVTIKRGDTLTALAKRFGTSIQAIVAANESIRDPNKIYAGDTIVIPGQGDSASPSSPGGGAADAPGASSSPSLDGDGPAVGLTIEDFKAVAAELGVELAAIQAVAEVEAAGSGFLASGRPKILFEGAQFERLTGGAFSGSHPHLSHPYPNSRGNYVGGEGEHDRLNEAMTLNANAALQSASWGRFQIMGFNYQAAGYDSVESYVEAMTVSEANHLGAFASFIEANPTMHRALQNLDWETFAYNYNGPDYASNGYHIKMAEAYARYS